MTVGELMKALQGFPEDMPVEAEICDVKRGFRLRGQPTAVGLESGAAVLYGPQETDSEYQRELAAAMRRLVEEYDGPASPR